MNILLSNSIKISMVAMGLMLVGCATKERAQLNADPANLLSQNYDVERPRDAAKEDKPVWVRDEKCYGYIPTPPSAGDEWVGGQYYAFTVRPGFFTNQRDAESRGLPYDVMGTSQPIIPIPPRTPNGAANGGVPSTGSSYEDLLQGGMPPPAAVQTVAQAPNPALSTDSPSFPSSLHLTRQPIGTVEYHELSDGSKVKVTYRSDDQVGIDWKGRHWELNFGGSPGAITLQSQ